jgi:hypothetical protein
MSVPSVVTLPTYTLEHHEVKVPDMAAFETERQKLEANRALNNKFSWFKAAQLMYS